MNYCDVNGCVNRKSLLVAEPKQHLIDMKNHEDSLWEDEPKQETTSEGFYRISKEIEYPKFDILSFKIGVEWCQDRICKSEFLQKLRATKSDAEARRLISEQFKKK